MVSFFAPEHINRQWSISRWWSMSGQVGQSVVSLVVCSRLCVCVQSERCLEPVYIACRAETFLYVVFELPVCVYP